ncbi:UNVERIFIED_CONTAM: hypothetical protein GTU68_051423 [Idotea baltica]|nr:hypothetical protein [Idotea baltica]
MPSQTCRATTIRSMSIRRFPPAPVSGGPCRTACCYIRGCSVIWTRCIRAGGT